MRRIVLAVLLGAVVGGASAATLDLDRYLRQESFTDIKISPGGEYIAATVPLEAGTALAIYRIADTLGFSETASFRHAFVRWSGVSPSQFRA